MKRNLSVILSILLLFSILANSQGVCAAEESTAPLPGNIIVTNNLNKADTVYIYDLNPGDLVKIYGSPTGSAVLAYSVVSGKKSDIIINIDQLGQSAGSVYVSIVSKGKSESARTRAEYLGEPVSEAPSAENITVTNNAGKADTIYVSGLNARDVVKVYNAQVKGKLLATRTIASNASDLTISVQQLGSSAGSIFVTSTSKSKLESARVQVDYSAETQSDAPDAGSITVTNNVKNADTVYVADLSAKDIVKVYNAESGGKLLGSKTVPSSGSDATISISQLGNASGYVYVTLTSVEKAESQRTRVAYEAEPGSDAPAADSIMVTNNAGKADTVYVIGLTPDDVVKVYNASAKGSLLGSAKASNSSLDASVNIAQLGIKAGSVFVSVTGSGKVESSRTEVPYPAEMKSIDISENSIIVTNNVGKSDTIYVKDLNPGDIVKVYNASSGGSMLGTKTVASSGTDATITITQLGSGSGYVYVSVISVGKSESARMQAYYDAEPVSGAAGENNISVTNNAGTADTVYVTGLSSGDMVKVYNSQRGGTLLGSAEVPASKTSATVSIAQLGTASGYVYVTITKSGSQESSRVMAAYSAEGSSDAPDINNIIVTNNVGKSDTIYVNGLTGGDTVNIYNSASQGTLLGTASVSGSGTEATVTVSQLGTRAGSVYVTVTSAGKLESARVEAAYRGESASDNAGSDNISVTNNAGIPDTVYVSGLTAGDTVKVYDSALGGTLLGTATVGSTSTDVIVSIPQISTAAGSIYVTVTSLNRTESARIEAAYASEAYSEAPAADNITVTNNISGTNDTVHVSGLRTGDTVKAYSAAAQGTLLGSATVSGPDTEAVISIPQLGSGQGSVYITVTSTGKLESSRTEGAYSAEGKTDAPSPDNITVTNNAGTSDTVYVSGLTAGDVVKVYDAQKAGKLLGTAEVSTFDSSVTVAITQLGNSSGSVYVTVTGRNRSESGRTEAPYTAEPSSSGTGSEYITVTNNAGMPDTVYVTGLTAGDIVKVYDTAAGGNLLGTATVSQSGTDVSVEINQLGSAAGTIYVSVTSTSKMESGRTEVPYKAEARTDAPGTSDISVSNNAGIASSVEVSGLKDYDTVKVYDAASGGALLGSGSVEAYMTEVKISVSQLNSQGGYIYVTVTARGKLESARTAVEYGSKTATKAPSASGTIVENNAGMADTVTVTGLDAGTVLKVYDRAAGGAPIGTATVPSGSMEATASITQLGTDAGSIYASLTAPGKTESERVRIDYTAETASQVIAAGNVTVENNSGISDIITVTGLSEGDAVKVYNQAEGGSKLSSATVPAGSVTAVISYPQLGAGAGSIYISVTGRGKTESGRTKVDYAAESVAPADSNIEIINNTGMADTITVSGLNENDAVKVYDAPSSGNLLGTALVAPGNTKASISVSQLTQTAGCVYVTVTNFGKAESSRTKADYTAEQSAAAPYIGNICVVNNSGMDDTITVTGLVPGDLVRVYDASVGGKLLGYATVASNSTQAVVSVDQLGTGSGRVYVSMTTAGKTESGRTEAFYVSERTSTTPYQGNIYIVNNVGIADTVLVTNLKPGDIVRVYTAEAGGNLLGYSSAVSDSAQVNITQLGVNAGSVYISLTESGKIESARTRIDYVSEQTTNAPYEGNIKVANNTGSPDTITLTGLSAGDLVKVYDVSNGGSLLGNATVAAGATQATVTVGQLGASSGSIYISVTSIGRMESVRVRVDYISEAN